jgi:hypothetical protein
MSEVKGRPRRWVVGLVVGALALLGGVAAVLLVGGGSLQELVAITREAEEAEVWRSYFTAEDCLIDSLTEDPDSLGESIERLKEQTASLAAHVEGSLVKFDDFGTRPWQGNLRDAHLAIVDHYTVWEDFLTDAAPVLAEINSEPSSITAGITTWLELAQTAVDPISTTFEDAGTRFEAAARTDADRELLDSLFIPADVSCTRTAV